MGKEDIDRGDSRGHPLMSLPRARVKDPYHMNPSRRSGKVSIEPGLQHWKGAVHQVHGVSDPCPTLCQLVTPVEDVDQRPPLVNVSDDTPEAHDPHTTAFVRR